MKTFMKERGWFAILACASVPNPLFDLAGFSSGYFLVPFKTFFSAVVIGKSIIKTHIQMIFVIFIFSKSKVDYFITFITKYIPILKDPLDIFFSNQIKNLSDPKSLNLSNTWFSQTYNFMIGFMVLFFLYSTINSLANEYLVLYNFSHFSLFLDTKKEKRGEEVIGNE